LVIRGPLFSTIPRLFVRLAYLFSRYPVVSQTFCDTEILALEKLGVELELYSIYPPPTSFRHGHAARMKARLHYAPSAHVLKAGELAAKKSGRWPAALIAEHDRRYGREYKAALRARNALYFADLFLARGITHFHVHFANRAAHTAIFIQAISGIPFSVSTHGQDFMVDLGNDALLGEICREARFIANETEFSKGLVRDRCPDSEPKMLRVFNGMDLTNFPPVPAGPARAVPKIVSTGRLIEFKGFHHLIAACADLKSRGLAFECEIIGEGPWRGQLQAQIDRLGVGGEVRLLGSLPQEEVFDRLRGCDIFALACIVDRLGASDVFPTVILEAMASGKPVISTRLAGVPEQIDPEQTGLLVAPGDEAALAEGLARLIQSPELRARFGAAARQRIESEFAVERTVLPLKALFEKFVPPAAPAPRAEAGWACLVEDWPGAGPVGERNDAELGQMRAAHPGLRIYVAQSASGRVPECGPEALRSFEFLPDAMVLEGEWQQERALARRMETWRVDLGQKLATDFFLQQARHALYLSRWMVRDGVRHLHALTARELLCAWMVHKLTGITFSVTVDERSGGFPEAVLLKLLADCAGIRFSTEKPFRETAKAHEAVAGQAIVSIKSRRGLEPEWLAHLSRWGAGRGAS
jgi:glycosyltransferase involved in cell wall biosynthesis